MKKIKLPSFLQPCLPSYDLRYIDINRDKKLIIISVLNNGDDRDLKWLTSVYSRKEIEAVVEKPTRGMWYKWILDYWLKIFNIKLPTRIYNKAIIRL